MLGGYLRERQLVFDRVIIGAMVRHRQTWDAAEVTVAAGVEPEILPGLNEYDFDALVGGYLAQFPPAAAVDVKNTRDFYRTLRLALGAWADGSLTVALPEPWHVFETRIRESLAALIARADAERVLVISSGGAISSLVREVLGLTVEQMIAMNLQMTNTGITRMMFKGDRVRLQSWNATPHLDQVATQHLLTYT